jgi:hypothetical protein
VLLVSKTKGFDFSMDDGKEALSKGVHSLQ